MNQQGILNHLNTATKDELVKAMCSSLRIESSFAAFEAVRRGLSDNDIAHGLHVMAKDNQFFWKPYHVSDLAYAALHILGIQEYCGDDPDILYWIQSRMDIGL